MFLTRAERGRETQRPEPGVKVTFPNGVAHFFPGGDERTALLIAATTPCADQLYLPATRIEFGTRLDRKWTCEKVVKAGEPKGG